MASIIKKTYHIRKYENIEEEMKKNTSTKKEGIVINLDDENGDKHYATGSDRQRIYPLNEVQKEGGEEEEEEDDRPKDPF